MKKFQEFITESGPRIKRVRVRIRGGKVQRNVRVSNVRGFTMRGGKLVKMSAIERLHRKRGARRGKIKRRAKQARIRLKMMRSLRKRHSMGLR